MMFFKETHSEKKNSQDDLPAFQIVKGFIRVVADIQRVENVPKDLLGQAG
jgi:hypothetical protein